MALEQLSAVRETPETIGLFAAGGPGLRSWAQ